MSRYYLTDSSNVRSIADGNNGEIVDEEPMRFMAGESCDAYEARMLRQDHRCGALNREDFELRRQFG